MTVVRIPWESRFSQLIKDMERYNATFHEELQILQLSESISADEKLSEALAQVDTIQFTSNNISAEQQRQGEALQGLLDATMQRLSQVSDGEQRYHLSVEDLRGEINQGQESFRQSREGKR